MIALARTQSVVGVLGLPSRDRRVIHRERYIRINSLRIARQWTARKRSGIDEIDPTISGCAGVPKRDLLPRLRIVRGDEVGERTQFRLRLARARRRGNTEGAARWNDPRTPVAGIRLDPGAGMRGRLQTCT